MKWERLSYVQLHAFSRDAVVVLPVGAVEQHGPHLPLGSDSLIAEGLAEALDQACGGTLLVLPAERIGCSQHHMSFPGSLTHAHETFAAAVLETLGSVIRHGFGRILVLNAHGGNQAIGGVVAEKAAERWPQAEVVFTSWWRVAAGALQHIVEGEYPSVGHACEFETSLMLLFEPSLVDMSQAQDDGIPTAAGPLRGDLLAASAATLPRSFDRFTRHGVFGRPTLASVEKGEKIAQSVTEALQSLLRSCWPGSVA